MLSHYTAAITSFIEDFKMIPNRPIASFFLRLALITALLLIGDAIDMIDLAKQTIRATALTVVDLSSDTPTQTARGD